MSPNMKYVSLFSKEVLRLYLEKMGTIHHIKSRAMARRLVTEISSVIIKDIVVSITVSIIVSILFTITFHVDVLSSSIIIQHIILRVNTYKLDTNSFLMIWMVINLL